MLQVAVKNDVDVLCFACQVPMHVYFADDGLIETWSYGAVHVSRFSIF